MSEEEIKKIAKEEFMNNVMEQLDSTLIFTYIQKLENQLQQKDNIINELDNWLGKKILSWEDDGNVSDNIYHERLAIQMIYFKLQELKGSDKE